MSKFKVGDIIKCEGEHFAEREILKSDNPYKYVTRFLEDNSVVESDKNTTDSIYSLKQ